MARYLVLGCRSWHGAALAALRERMPEHEWVHAPRPGRRNDIGRADFDGAFVLHWSWKIQPFDLAAGWFVGFHMGQLPRDRGGSPLQNLIARGDRSTHLNALRLVEEIDAGPVILATDLSLEGSAEEIYLRADRQAVPMIEAILQHPVLIVEADDQHDGVDDQHDGVLGDVSQVPFVRRTPAHSRVPPGLNLLRLHDHVRMLDAKDYPPAFVEVDGYRIELTRSALRAGEVVCDARITRTGY